jgi:DNA-directed RNA polymerase II subunit RPB4
MEAVDVDLERVLPHEEIPLVDKNVFKGAHVLTNSEINILLSSHLSYKRERNPTYLPPPVMQRTIDYVGKFNGGKNEEALQQIRM